jgi:hypothetical protein
MLKRFSSLVLTLWLAAVFGSICLQHTVFAETDVEQDFSELPVNFVTLNTCTGEFIQVQGTALIGWLSCSNGAKMYANASRSICDSRWVSRLAHRCSKTGLESFPSPGSSVLRPLSWVPVW